MVLDSRVGALDRTLGFLFGLGRGLIIVVIAYMFFDWLVPDRSKPDWVAACQIEGRAQQHRRLAEGRVAGRPGKHHFEEAEAPAAGGHRYIRTLRRPIEHGETRQAWRADDHDRTCRPPRS